MTEANDPAQAWLDPRVEGIPIPETSALAAPYWEGCRAHELRYQRCTECGTIPPMPTPICPRCHRRAVAWIASSGRGSLYSWTVVWRPQHPAFDVPYAPAVVLLDQGAYVMAAVVGCRVGDLRAGLELEVAFHAVTDSTDLGSPDAATLTLPFFHPRRACPG